MNERPLDQSWHALWRSLQAARRRGDVEGVVAVGAELVNLSSVRRRADGRRQVSCYHVMKNSFGRTIRCPDS
jgi:hypothetical protein